MSRKKAVPPAPETNTLQIVDEPGKSRERLLAEVSMATEVLNAVTARTFAKGGMGDFDITETVSIMRGKVAAAQSGDLAGAEAMLAAQAVALDAIFNEMARRAALNMGQHLPATETYMRLAMKAQSQARTTLQTLAEIKNPRPVAFVKQANISHGPQQVNNHAGQVRGEFSPTVKAPARAENFESEQNKLLEASRDGEWMDTGTAGAAGGNDKEVATVGEIHRPPIR